MLRSRESVGKGDNAQYEGESDYNAQSGGVTIKNSKNEEAYLVSAVSLYTDACLLVRYCVCAYDYYNKPKSGTRI